MLIDKLVSWVSQVPVTPKALLITSKDIERPSEKLINEL